MDLRLDQGHRAGGRQAERRGRRGARVALFALAAGAATAAWPQQPEPAQRYHTRIEVKRAMTSRGTPDESTRSNLRLDRLLDGPVALLRLDLPFPDEETDFNGDPFNPRLGDVKVRVGFRALRSGALSFPSFVELTLPTADPETLGTGKYQLGAALRVVAPIEAPFLDPAAHRTVLEAQVQQVVSVAGDRDRQDINVTKIEFTLYDLWQGRYTAKLKLKPNIDWIRDGKSGAVAEIEGGLLFARHWRTWLMLGKRVWGPEGISGTYDTRVELGLSRYY